MLKIIIADDEPLVQAGIKSMIDWNTLDMCIAGIAANGQAAYDLIGETDADIVITDIKMPVMSGLELARKCLQEKRQLPLFIILTSYEDFHFAKEALECQVSDYLVKLDLTPETLEAALRKAAERALLLKKNVSNPFGPDRNRAILKEQFFLRLLLNLFEDEAQMRTQAKHLGLALTSPGYMASYLEIQSEKLALMNYDQQLQLYSSCLQMVRELIARYQNCAVVSVDTRHFCILFFVEDPEDCGSDITNAISQVSDMIYKYYSVRLQSACGQAVTDPGQIHASFEDARSALSACDSRNHIVQQVKKYIRAHIREKLTLNTVADRFNISPSYLSTLFSKYSKTGFNDYINQKKVDLAKQMLSEGELKIYEVSEQLGFESAFYFSRVFKKITGQSPRDYMNH